MNQNTDLTYTIQVEFPNYHYHFYIQEIDLTVDKTQPTKELTFVTEESYSSLTITADTIVYEVTLVMETEKITEESTGQEMTALNENELLILIVGVIPVMITLFIVIYPFKQPKVVTK